MKRTIAANTRDCLGARQSLSARSGFKPGHIWQEIIAQVSDFCEAYRHSSPPVGRHDPNLLFAAPVALPAVRRPGRPQRRRLRDQASTGAAAGAGQDLRSLQPERRLYRCGRDPGPGGPAGAVRGDGAARPDHRGAGAVATGHAVRLPDADPHPGPARLGFCLPAAGPQPRRRDPQRQADRAGLTPQ
ncbi:hypothetical protein D3C76_744300 [compost metagenome]